MGSAEIDLPFEQHGLKALFDRLLGMKTDH
jgi:hypothetical protein